MSSTIAPMAGSIDSDHFEISTVGSDGKTTCANKGCTRDHDLNDPIELAATADGMAVPFASVAFCSLSCAKEFAENGPYTDIIPSEETDIDQARYGSCDIYSTIYVEKISANGMIEYTLGTTPEEAMRRGVKIKSDLIDLDSVSPEDINSTIEELS
jgi:hypothetical protein